MSKKNQKVTRVRWLHVSRMLGFLTMSAWSKVFAGCMVVYYAIAFVICWVVNDGKLPGNSGLDHAAWILAMGLMLSIAVLPAAALTTGILRLVFRSPRKRS